MKIISLDVGYGFTKAVYDGKPTIFPSLVGPARELTFKVTERQDLPGEMIEIRGGNYFVGKKAELSDRTFPLRTRDWVESDLYAALMASGLVRATVGDPASTEIFVVTGLPVEYYARDKGKAEDQVRSVASHLGLKVGGVRVIPQPFGSFYDHILGMDGAPTMTESLRLVGVVDVGQHTTDYILIKNLRDNLERASGSMTGGVFQIIDRVRRDLISRYDRDNITISEAEECVLKGRPIKIKGKDIEVSDIVQSQIRAVAQGIVGEIKSRWAHEGEPELVLLTGGGILLRSYLQGISHSTQVIEGAQLANARGYYKFGMAIRRAA